MNNFECPTKKMERGEKVELSPGNFIFEIDPITHTTKEFKGYDEHGKEIWIPIVRGER